MFPLVRPRVRLGEVEVPRLPRRCRRPFTAPPECEVGDDGGRRRESNATILRFICDNRSPATRAFRGYIDLFE